MLDGKQNEGQVNNRWLHTFRLPFHAACICPNTMRSAQTVGHRRITAMAC